MSEIRWTRGWHERAKVEVANGAHLDRDESELALAEIERAWGEIDVIRTAGGPDVAGLHDDAHGQNCLGCLVGYALSEYEREGTRMAAEIERLSKERGELLAEATAATNQISDMHAEIERLKSTKSAALEKYMAEARDLRVTVCWAVDRNDLASAPIETVLSLLRGRAPAPLTEAEARAWADLHDQTQAGCLTREEAHAADVALILSASRGDIPDAVRPEASPAVQAAIRGLERVTPPTGHADGDTCPSCTEVLGSPSVCAISHDFRPGAYDGHTVTTTPGHTWQRDASGGSDLVPVRPSARPVLDQVYAIVRPFYEVDEHAEGRPAASWVLEQVREAITTPVDVPHDLRLDKLSRFAGADAATKPGASCPDCHEDCIGWVVDGNRCGGAP